MSSDVDHYVARLVIPKADGEFSVGSAYPIKPGVLLTAKHNVYDKDSDSKIFPEVIWKNNSAKNPEKESKVTEIAFIDDIDGIDVDLAVIYAETPDDTPDAQLLFSIPASHTLCTVYGFPRSSESPEGRKLDSESGKINGKITQDFRVKVTVDADRDYLSLWKGISGGPVFDLDNRLIGIIYETPNISDKDSNVNKDCSSNSDDDFPQGEVKSTIYAVSIPFLWEQSGFFKQLFFSDNELLEKNKELIANKLRDDDLSTICADLFSVDIGDVGHHYCNLLFSGRWHEALMNLIKLSNRLVGNNYPNAVDVIEDLLNLSVSSLYQTGIVHFRKNNKVVTTPLALDVELSLDCKTLPSLVHRNRRSNLETIQGKNAVYCKDLSVKESGLDINAATHDAIKSLDLAVGLLHKKADPRSEVNLSNCRDENVVSLLNEQIALNNDIALDEVVYLARNLDDKYSNITDDIKIEIQKLLPDLPIGEYNLQPTKDEQRLIAIVIKILNLLKGK